MKKVITTLSLLTTIIFAYAFNSIVQAATDTEGSRRLLIYKFGGAVTNKWDEKKFTLYGFEDDDRKKGSIPWEDTEENPRVLRWADPPDGVTADAPKVLQYDGSTVAWGNAGRVDNSSITTNVDLGAVADGVASIYGFEDAVDKTIPVVADFGFGEEKYLVWQDYYEPDSIVNASLGKTDSIETTTLYSDESQYGDTTFHNIISLYGFNYQGRINGAVPYFRQGEDGGRVLNWADPNENDTTYPKVLKFDGTYVEWGTENFKGCDDLSVTTNKSSGAAYDDVISIYGFDHADAGTVPQKGDDGYIHWEKPKGTAIEFVGTDGGTAVCGEGAKTNTVTFASASDSNISVSCSESNGNVTITIGVYYVDDFE